MDTTVELDADSIIKTAAKLEQRVQARFPEANLVLQSERLVALANRAKSRSEEIARPIWWVRGLFALLLFGVILGLAAAPLNIEANTQQRDLLDWIQIAEAAINDVILLGAGIVFLITLESRIKRRRALRELHQLRSFAHVIDMHQLTKDPHRVIGAPEEAESTIIEAELTPFELSRYLDYCSELLAISGKIAALYVQHFDDQVVLESVTEIETLATGLSRKIWQKMMVLFEAYPESVTAMGGRRSRPESIDPESTDPESTDPESTDPESTD